MFKIGEDDYAVLIRDLGDVIAEVVFSVNINGKWTLDGVTGKLKNSEILTLFGTIYSVIKQTTFNEILFTSDVKKENIRPILTAIK